jgi:hypothetical protein
VGGSVSVRYRRSREDDSVEHLDAPSAGAVQVGRARAESRAQSNGSGETEVRHNVRRSVAGRYHTRRASL